MSSTPASIASLTALGGLISLIAEAVADDMERESGGGDEENEEEKRNA